MGELGVEGASITLLSCFVGEAASVETRDCKGYGRADHTVQKPPVMWLILLYSGLKNNSSVWI